MTLKEARKAKGYTLEQLAQECGTNKSQLSRIENGSRNPSDELARKLVAVLGEFEATAKKAKFTQADTFQIIGEIYGYINAKVPGSSSPDELAYAVEHPTEGLLNLHKKVLPTGVLTGESEIWIAETMSNIDLEDYKNADKTASAAEQSAFLMGYYKGIKRSISTTGEAQK